MVRKVDPNQRETFFAVASRSRRISLCDLRCERLPNANVFILRISDCECCGENRAALDRSTFARIAKRTVLTITLLHVALHIECRACAVPAQMRAAKVISACGRCEQTCAGGAAQHGRDTYAITGANMPSFPLLPRSGLLLPCRAHQGRHAVAQILG